MTPSDRQVIITALAFIGVVLNDGTPAPQGNAEKVKKLSKLVSEFCEENVRLVFSESAASSGGEDEATTLGLTL